MRLPPARAGSPLLLKERDLDFSFYPMKRSNRRWGIHSTLYAADPWAVLAGTVNSSIPAGPDRDAAASFVRQAREYFGAAERASSIETRPLLYYYSFLNVAKAIALSRGRAGLVGKVSHGISVAGGANISHTPAGAQLQVGASSSIPGGTKSAIDELHWALEGAGVATGTYEVSEILAQSVIGHRMWREAFTQPRVERFIPVDSIILKHDVSSRKIWVNFRLSRSSLSSRGRGVTKTLRDSSLLPTFEAVKVSDPSITSEFHTFEQRNTVTYSGRAADVVAEAVGKVRPLLWQTITAAAPYRRYYLYLSPANERRMPQWLSIYATLFWLGSLTRYQPVELFDALDGNYGPFFREFLETQPRQLLYILASDAKQQVVAKAGIV